MEAELKIFLEMLMGETENMLGGGKKADSSSVKLIESLQLASVSFDTVSGRQDQQRETGLIFKAIIQNNSVKR